MPQTFPEMFLLDSRKRTPARQPEQPAPRTRRQNELALAGVPLFSGISRKHLGKLAAQADEMRFEPGQTLVQEGMKGETLFVVLAGQAKVVRGKRKVGEVLPGDFFGELSAIDAEPRTASVVAQTPMRVLRVFRHTLVKMIEDEPGFAVKLLDGMVRRLRQIRQSSGG